MKRLSKQNRILMSTIAIFAITIVFAITYAAFSQTLNINGSGVVRNSSWNVHFVADSTYAENGYLKPSNTLSSSVKILSNPSINDTTIGDYSVSLTTPGDTIVYTFDVINEGDYNAKISGFNLPSPTCIGTGESQTLDEVKVCGGEYNSETYQRQIEYTLKYKDGTPVSNNDPLLSKETKTMVLTLTYKEFNDANLLPANDITLDHLNFTINYVQDGSALVNEDGSTPLITYDTYTVGDTFTVENDLFYVIEDSGIDQDYVVALKDFPLTVSEITAAGGISQYTYNDSRETGGMPFGSSMDYDTSNVKAVVDSWAQTKFSNNELKSVNGYNARLITRNELVTGLGCQYISCSNDSPYSWTYFADYGYWTMTPVIGLDGNYIYYVIPSSGQVTDAMISMRGGTIRPVINIYKSRI